MNNFSFKDLSLFGITHFIDIVSFMIRIIRNEMLLLTKNSIFRITWFIQWLIEWKLRIDIFMEVN